MKYKIRIGDVKIETYAETREQAWEDILEETPHYRFTDYTSRDLEEIEDPDGEIRSLSEIVRGSK